MGKLGTICSVVVGVILILVPFIIETKHKPGGYIFFPILGALFILFVLKSRKKN